MTDSNSETLAELRGFFRAFEWVNSKTNHDYSFNIETAPKSSDFDADIAGHFAVWHPTKLTRKEAEGWRELLFSSLVRWLLSYLTDPPSIGQLTDESKTFALSFPTSYEAMIDPIIQKLDSLAPIQNAYTITVETQKFYACESTDIVLDCRDVLVFLHFDVCD